MNMATMTAQHFVLIADTIAVLPVARPMRETIAEIFADQLADTNPLFDRERFLAAANK